MINNIPRSAVTDLTSLDIEQIKHIDAALSRVGDFGEVRLIKQRGRLRYIQSLESEKLNDGFIDPE